MVVFLLTLGALFPIESLGAKVYTTNIYPKIDTTKKPYRYVFHNTKNYKYTDFEENCTNGNNINVSYDQINKGVVLQISDLKKVTSLNCYFVFKNKITWDYNITKIKYNFVYP